MPAGEEGLSEGSVRVITPSPNPLPQWWRGLTNKALAPIGGEGRGEGARATGYALARLGSVS
jgi:hypothetical protein